MGKSQLDEIVFDYRIDYHLLLNPHCFHVGWHLSSRLGIDHTRSHHGPQSQSGQNGC
jgi:hypothetical protein